MSDNKVEAEQLREQVEKMDRILEACWRYFDHCLQEARAEVDRLRKAIRQHRWEMREYKGAFYDEELWAAIGPLPSEGGE